MEDYALRFSWNLQIAGTSFEMNEYFKPYNIDALSELFDNEDYIFEVLKQNNEYGMYFLSQCVSKRKHINISDSSSNVVVLNNEQSIWINDSNDIYENTLWDYLSDFRTVFSLYKSQKDQKYLDRILKIANLDLMSRLRLDMMKVDLSLLIYCDWRGEEEKFENDIVEYYKWVHKEIISEKFTTYLRNDNYHIVEKLSDFENRLSNSKIGLLVRNINDWIKELFTSDTLTERMFEDTISLIKIKFREIPKILGETYAEKMKFIKRLNRVHMLGISRNELFSLCVSYTYYQDEKQTIFNNIVDNNVHHINSIPSIESPDFEYYFKKLAKFFEGTNSFQGRSMIGKLVLEKYKNDKSGCFSIMEESAGKKYFAFSGIKEHGKHERHKQFEDLAHKIMEDVLNLPTKINIKDVRKHNYDFNWAYLSGNTMRHTNYVKDNKNIEYISSPIKLDDDIEISDWEKDKGNIGFTYGCCERKIMAFSNNYIDKLFFVRWAPCKKCRPALLSSSYAISVLALGLDFDNWINNGRSNELKRYIIKQQKYSVHEII